jgi:hypothetical protein
MPQSASPPLRGSLAKVFFNFSEHRKGATAANN